MSLILTADELVALTDQTQVAAQIRWLVKREWIFERGSSGRPKVSRSFFEFKMGPRNYKEVHVAHVGINLAALDRVTRKA